MESIFHERQDGSLCAQHCLNSLLQGDYYSAVDLAQIAEDLDKAERLHMAEGGPTNEYHNFLNEKSSNYDDSGFFSIQVLQKALESWTLELVPFTSQSEIALLAKANPIDQKAFICNFKEHWYTIRKIGNYWFNLNSLFKKPQLISDTYLSVLLAQLKTDGYSIFVVAGDLPRSRADMVLEKQVLNVNEIIKENTIRTKRDEYDEENEGFDDRELKKAIKMSLVENDIELNHSSKASMLYPSLITENLDDDDELKRAIELSMQVHEQNTGTSTTSSQNPSTSTAPSHNPQPLTADELRNKRLQHFNNKKEETQ